MEQDKTYFFDKKENIQKVLRIFYIICAGLVLAELVIHRHVLHSWEHLFGFYALYGFVACVLLVLLATQMRKLIMRKEDYYAQDYGSDTTDSRHVDD